MMRVLFCSVIIVVLFVFFVGVEVIIECKYKNGFLKFGNVIIVFYGS